MINCWFFYNRSIVDKMDRLPIYYLANAATKKRIINNNNKPRVKV